MLQFVDIFSFQTSSIPSPSIPATGICVEPTPIGLPPEIKVEDIDLDSGDDDEEEENDRIAMDAEMDGTLTGNQLVSRMVDGQDYGCPSHIPSLTLQSFARIPSLTPLIDGPLHNEENVATSHDFVPGKKSWLI